MRASNIPARYVYGTVELPIANADNWVGGTTSPDATQQLWGQGGVPNTALVSGGATTAIRLEHIWVEAWLDYAPSRGAINLTGDSWIPMDASYKQYQYSSGLDLKGQVPFDANAFVNAAQQGATVDNTAGYVQNLNQANIQNQLNDYQSRLKTYIENQNANATVGDVIGKKIIPTDLPPTQAASLPYKVTATANRYASLPTTLQQQFQYSLYTSQSELDNDSPVWQYQAKTSQIAQKKITLAWVPTTDDDRKTIESYLPKPHQDGSPIQPNEFPSSRPAYSIHVTLQLRLEGQTVATGGSYTLGTELIGQGGFNAMNLQGQDLTTDTLIAGQTGALGVSCRGLVQPIC